MISKNTVSDLAIFGGTPAFSSPLHVGKPNIGNRIKFQERFNDILDRGWLTNNGKYVQQFEELICQQLDVRNCICMCNGTLALEIAARALGMKGEVIVPSFTFVATAHSLQWQEIKPVFCDIDLATHCVDPTEIPRHITPNTTGVIAVNLWGNCSAVDEICRVARDNGLRLIFDSSHAFGCTHRKKSVGTFGDAEVFSFHATKFMNSFEGGAVVTNNDELAQKIRLMKNFGFSGYDNVIYIGTNGKMSEPAAAMGLTNLERIDELIASNRSNYLSYQKGLVDIPGLFLQSRSGGDTSNYQYIVVEIDETSAGLDRDTIMEILHAENVLARRYFYPGCHRMEPYRSLQPHAGLLLPNTELVCRRVLVLPTGTSVTQTDLEDVSGIIRFAVNNAAEVKREMAQNSESGTCSNPRG